MKMKRYMVVRTLKALFKLVITLVLPDEKPDKPRYTALHAEQLYEDGLITDMEYVRCVYGDKR